MLGAQSPGVESVNSNVTGVTCETVQTLISGAMEAWKLDVDVAARCRRCIGWLRTH